MSFKFLNDIRKANKDLEFDFFASDDLYYWGTEFPEGQVVYDGNFFITSDLEDIGEKNGPRRYTVRFVHPDGRVVSYGQATKYPDLAHARAAAWEAVEIERQKEENRDAWAKIEARDAAQSEGEIIRHKDGPPPTGIIASMNPDAAQSEEEPDKFVATINIPGYLPQDDEPSTFATARDAWRWLRDERKRQEDEAEEPGNQYSDGWATLSYVTSDEGAAKLLNDDGTGTFHLSAPGYKGDYDQGLVYSVAPIA